MQKSANTTAELIEPIRERWSPRAFNPEKEVTRELLTELLEAARWSPSCKG